MHRRLKLLVSGTLLAAGCHLFDDEAKTPQRTDIGQVEAQPIPGAAAGGAGSDRCPEALSGTLSEVRTITADCGPVRVRGPLRIDGGALTLEAGATLRFEAGATLEVGRSQPGSLQVRGSATIEFTAGSRLEVGGSGQGLLFVHAGAPDQPPSPDLPANTEAALAAPGPRFRSALSSGGSFLASRGGSFLARARISWRRGG